MATKEAKNRERNENWSFFGGSPTVRQRIKTAADWMEENKSFIKWMIRKYAYGLSIDQDDLYQEVALAIVKAWPSYNEGWVDVERTTYFGVCIRNHIRGIRRKLNTQARCESTTASTAPPLPAAVSKANWRDRLAELQQLEISGGGDDPHAWAEASELRRRLLEYLWEQRPEHRQLLILVLEGMPQAEAAKKVRLSQSLASYHVRRMKKQLWEVVDEFQS